jgi:hypothetical protein
LTKTYCDKCGGECVYYTATLYGNITHTTGQGEVAADEGIEPVQLCKPCLDAVAAALSLTIRTSRYGAEIGDPVASVELRAHP